MDQTFMKEKKILPLVLSMALPMIISMAVNSLYNIIDSFFVAKVSENAMTALSLVYPIQNLVNSIAVGFGVGINAVVAFHLGAGEMQNADRATPAFEESISDASISFTDHSESPILFTVIVPFSLSDFTDKISVVSAE